jgi:hypothetical protein
MKRRINWKWPSNKNNALLPWYVRFKNLFAIPCTALAGPQPPADGEVVDGPAVQSREPASVTTESSDEELLELMPQQMRDDLAAAARALAGVDPDNIKAASAFRIILNRHVADHARAVLARWGTPNSAETRRSLAPIPVSERLPEAGECDAEGRCWLLTVEDEYPQWRLHSIEGAQPGGAMIWVPVDSSPGVMVDCFYTSHWLPASALPLPREQ